MDILSKKTKEESHMRPAPLQIKGSHLPPLKISREETTIPRKNIFAEKIFAKRSRNGATLDFALAQSPESKVCGDEGEVRASARRRDAATKQTKEFAASFKKFTKQ